MLGSVGPGTAKLMILGHHFDGTADSLTWDAAVTVRTRL